jgi:hypothetical protein
MPTLNEGKLLSDVVLFENATAKYSRNNETLITGQNLTMGTVVGKITASGKITILAPAAVDGSQTAFGVLLADVNATAADQLCPVLRREAIVKDAGLVWPGGITNPQKATATAQLELVGIVIRAAY